MRFVRRFVQRPFQNLKYRRSFALPRAVAFFPGDVFPMAAFSAAGCFGMTYLIGSVVMIVNEANKEEMVVPEVKKKKFEPLDENHQLQEKSCRFTVEKKIPDRLKEHTFVHLKGFASGLRFSSGDEMTRNDHEPFVKYAVDLLEKTKPSCLSWDGDKYHKESFTMLVPKIAEMYENRTGSKLPILAFRLEQDIDSFLQTWREAPVSGAVVAVKGKSWNEVWPSAIQQTKGEYVICFGGGAVTLDEFKKCGKETKWKVFLANRVKGQKVEECHLKDCRDSSQIEFISEKE